MLRKCCDEIVMRFRCDWGEVEVAPCWIWSEVWVKLEWAFRAVDLKQKCHRAAYRVEFRWGHYEVEVRLRWSWCAIECLPYPTRAEFFQWSSRLIHRQQTCQIPKPTPVSSISAFSTMSSVSVSVPNSRVHIGCGTTSRHMASRNDGSKLLAIEAFVR